MSHRQTRSRTTGFSLIELMIAMVAGLIVLGAVLTFTVSMIRAYSENIRSTRLTQDLRTGMNVIVRDLRRAGFDSTSVTRVLTDENPSGFTGMTASGSCVRYEYDRGVGGGGGIPAATEIRGIRLNSATGALQMNASSSSIDCAGSSGAWVDVTDPSIIEVTAFTPKLINSPFCADLGNNLPTFPTVYQKAEGSVRNLTMCLKGRLRSDPTIARHITSTTRVRAENVAFILNSGVKCPSPATNADVLPSPLVLNTDCE